MNFVSKTYIKESDGLKIGSGCGILIYSAWQGLRRILPFCDVLYNSLDNVEDKNEYLLAFIEILTDLGLCCSCSYVLSRLFSKLQMNNCLSYLPQKMVCHFMQSILLIGSA